MAAIKQETGGGTPSSSTAAAATAATPTTPQPTLQQQQFCVRWNSYQTNLQNTFPKLLSSEHFVDVTLACEAEMIKCHKVVLSACSTYFEKLLVQNPCQHPIIFMKDMKYAEMQALVDFMYRGEVNVTQDELPSLLRSAEALQIRGLCGSDQLLSQHYLGQQQQQQQHQMKADKTPLAPVVNGATTTTNQMHDSATAKKPEINGDSRTGTPTLRREMSQGSSTDRSEDGDSLEPQMTIKEDYDNDDSYYDNGDELMDTDFLEQEQTEEQAEEQDADLEDDIHQPGTSTTTATGTGTGAPGTGLSIFQNIDKSPDYAIANVSCQYNDGSPGGGIPSARRIRRSEAELRRAAECITRGQTFQTVSDQFNIPISTIRFYMARKGILPRRKRGRACSAPGGPMSSPGGQMSSTYNTSSSGGGAILGVGHGTPLSGNGGFHNAPGNTSPSGPPYHIVHYKLPVLGAKLK